MVHHPLFAQASAAVGVATAKEIGPPKVFDHHLDTSSRAA